MMLTIKRFAYASIGTFGQMEMSDGTVLYTVEDPWRNNAPSVSCIPLGDYECEPRKFNRGGYDAIHVTNVPNRDNILFHRGNTEVDVEGCICPGTKLGFVNGRWAVQDSVGAFDVLMRHYGDTEFDLQIRSYDPAADSYGIAVPAPSRSGSGTPDHVLRKHGVVFLESQSELPADFRLLE